MKSRLMIVCAVLAATCTAVLAVAGNADFSFLKDFEDLSDNWHRSASVLKILAFSVSVLGALVAFLQLKNLRMAWKNTVSAVLALLIAILNAGLTLFYADSRTYEQAAVKYDSTIQGFRILNESIDVSDPQIAQEFSHAKADLIQSLFDIRLNLLEGKSPTLPAFIPLVYAQDARAWQPADTAHFIYAIGVGVNPADLQQAKLSAIQDANEKLVAQLRGTVTSGLAGQQLGSQAKEEVLRRFVDPSAETELLSHSEIEKVYFSKDNSGYHYSVVKRLLKDVVSYHYLSLLQSQTNLNSISGFSREQFEQYVRSLKAH